MLLLARYRVTKITVIYTLFQLQIVSFFSVDGDNGRFSGELLRLQVQEENDTRLKCNCKLSKAKTTGITF